MEDEARLRFQGTILENVRDSIIVTDVDGKIIDWNHGAELLFGYTESEVLGRAPAFLYPEERSSALAADLDAIARGEDYVAEWEGRRKDGSRVDVEIRTTRLLDAAGRQAGFIGVGKDISARKAAERERDRLHVELQEALAAAEAANRSKDEFLAMLGHELRNPLAPIVTAIEMMKLRAGGAATREQQVIERQVVHLLRLVDDLLDVSRITRGKVELKRTWLEIEVAITKAVEIAAPAVELRGHRLRVDVPRSGLLVCADAARLAQVFSNLLTNAARYTNPGGVILIRAYRDGDAVAVSVKDNGVGIEPDLLPTIFELFVQGPRSSARSRGGLGIGLSVVHNLVEMHGGDVVAHSEGAGKGTELVVRLPFATKERREAEASTTKRRSTVRSRRVLLVDDNTDAVELLGDALRLAGHDVRVASDGPSAIALADRFQFDVGVLDIGLPVMDGYELARRLASDRGERPVLIALSGYGQDCDRARSQDAGFSEHLVKPVELDRLLERIETLGAPPP